MSVKGSLPQPEYAESQYVYVGVCWGCGVSFVRTRESVVQSIIQGHGRTMDHAVSIFPVDKSNAPGYAVHCHDCGYTRRFDTRNTTTPERSAQSGRAGHMAGCKNVVIRELYYG